MCSDLHTPLVRSGRLSQSRSSTDGAKPHDAGGAACEIDVEDELDAIGTGAFHGYAVLICGLANGSDAVLLMGIGYILPELHDVTHTMRGGLVSRFLDVTAAVLTVFLALWRAGVLSASVFIGMLVGGLLAGVFGDRVGRLPCLVASLACSGACFLLAAATHGAHRTRCLPASLPPSLLFTSHSVCDCRAGWAPLAVCLIGAGVGIGGSIPSVFTLYTEYLPTKSRGTLISLLASMWMAGQLYGAGSAWIIMGRYRLSWRVFVLAASAPSLLGMCLTLAFLPESPRFLYARGEYDRCLASLRVIARGCGVVTNPLTSSSAVVAACITSDGAFTPLTPTSVSPRVAPYSSPQQRRTVGLLRSLSTQLPSARDGALADSQLMGGHGRSLSASLHSGAKLRVLPPEDLDKPLMFRSASVIPRDSRQATQLMVSMLAGVLHPVLLRSTLLLCLCWFALSFGFYGLMVWIPSIFKKAHISWGMYESVFIVAAANLPGNLASLVLMDRVGRCALMYLGVCGLLLIGMSRVQKGAALRLHDGISGHGRNVCPDSRRRSRHHRVVITKRVLHGGLERGAWLCDDACRRRCDSRLCCVSRCSLTVCPPSHTRPRCARRAWLCWPARGDWALSLDSSFSPG